MQIFRRRILYFQDNNPFPNTTTCNNKQALGRLAKLKNEKANLIIK